MPSTQPSDDGSTESDTITNVHGIIASVAWVIFFPIGALAIRLVKSSNAWWVHASIQIFTIVLVTVAAGTGIAIADGDQVSTLAESC